MMPLSISNNTNRYIIYIPQSQGYNYSLPSQAPHAMGLPLLSEALVIGIQTELLRFLINGAEGGADSS